MPTFDQAQRFEQIEAEIASMRAGMGDLTDLTQQQEEAIRRLDAARQQLGEDVNEAIRSFSMMEDQIDRMTDRMHGAFGQKLEQERVRFNSWATNIASTFGEALRRSISRSLPTSMTEGTMGIGAAGQKIGSVIGAAAGQAIGFYFGGPTGAAVGAQLGNAIVGTVASQLETIITGPRVSGARLAPVILGGATTGIPGGTRQFEQIGLEYMNTIRRISQLLNVSADDVLRYASPLAQVGVGFRGAAAKETEFAIGVEKLLALQPGSILKMQTELVSKYGESVKGVRDIIHQVRGGQREFIALNIATGDSIQKALSAGSTYTDMLTQISAGASTSGASMRALNEMAGSLVKTMATMGPGGRAGMRPGQMTEVAQSTLRALLPQLSTSWSEEARRSGVDRMLLEATGYGKGYARRVLAGAPEELKRQPQFTFQMAEREYLMRHKKYAMQGVLAKMSGVFADYKQGGVLAAGMRAEQLGVTPAGTQVIIDLMRDFEKEHGFNLNRFAPNAEQNFRKFMREKQKDPVYRERLSQLGEFKDVMDVALEQGRASKTSMEKIADAFGSVAGELTNYWDKWKQATAEVFGIQPGGTGATAAAVATAAITGPAGAAIAGGSAIMGAIREQRDLRRQAQPTAPAPAITQQTMVLNKETTKAANYEVSTRDSNVLPSR